MPGIPRQWRQRLTARLTLTFENRMKIKLILVVLGLGISTQIDAQPILSGDFSMDFWLSGRIDPGDASRNILFDLTKTFDPSPVDPTICEMLGLNFPCSPISLPTSIAKIELEIFESDQGKSISLDGKYPIFFSKIIGAEGDGLRISHLDNEGFNNGSPFDNYWSLSHIDFSKYDDLSMNVFVENFHSSGWFNLNAQSYQTNIQVDYTVTIEGVVIPEPSSTGIVGLFALALVIVQRRVARQDGR